MEEKPTVSDFLQAAVRRFERLRESGETSFQVRIAGQVIEQRFCTAEHAATVRQYMTGMIVPDTTTPDAVFYYWNESVDVYKPESANNVRAIWQSRDDTGYLRVTPGYAMIGVDHKNRAYLFCRHPSGAKEQLLFGHSMVVLFGWWARQNQMMLLHSACVGVNGKGVMISARGGGGKSTLSVSCLLGGFDFVADDYILVNREGPLRAMPLYRTVGLNPDMESKLKPGLPVVRVYDERGGKMLLDASRFDFAKELPVHAILCPKIGGGDEPCIRPTDRGSVLAKIIDSTASQLGVFRDPEQYRQMAQRLLTIPVYEISLCRDLDKNRECLRKFIEKELDTCTD